MKLASLAALFCLVGCTQFKEISLSSLSNDPIDQESLRLGIDRSRFISADQVFLGDDMIISTNQLSRVDGRLVIVEPNSSGVTIQGNVTGSYWSGSVPVLFANDVPEATKTLIRRACEEFGVRCVCYSGQAKALRVTVAAQTYCPSGAAACAEYPGSSGAHVHLRPENSYAVVVHEVGHTLGLVHEHQRSDRDEYVERFQNTNENDIRIFGTAIGPFDFESIMLYQCAYAVLRDSSLCALNGLNHSRISRGDWEAKRADNGTTDLNACTPVVFNAANYSAAADVYINGSNADSVTISDPATNNTRYVIRNTGAQGWPAGTVRVSIGLADGAGFLASYIANFAPSSVIMPGQTYEFNVNSNFSSWNLSSGVNFNLGMALTFGGQWFPGHPVSNVRTITVRSSNLPTTNFNIILQNHMGHPITSGAVQVSTNQYSEPISTRTPDSQGRVNFNLPNGTYFFRQTAPGYQQDNFFLQVPNELTLNQGVFSAPVRQMNPSPDVIGWIDSLNSSNELSGWACAKGIASSIQVAVFVNGPYGAGGSWLATVTANRASEQAVANACQSTGAAYRFLVPLAAHAPSFPGGTLFVHGMSPTGGANNLIGNSGNLRFPQPTMSGSLSASGCTIPQASATCNASFSASVQNAPAAGIRARFEGQAINQSFRICGSSLNCAMPVGTVANFIITLHANGNDANSQILATRNITVNSFWQQLPGGGAVDIGVANGSPGWVTTSSGAIFRWGANGWANIPGAASRVDVGPDGRAWVVNSGGDAFRYNGTTWEHIGGGAADIGIGNSGKVWATATNGTIYRRDGESWTLIPGAASRIDVDPNGNAWVVNSGGQIFRYDGSTWINVPGTARDITVSGNGTVYIVGVTPVAGGYAIYRLNSVGSWDYAGIGGVAVSASNGAAVVVVQDNGSIHYH